MRDSVSANRLINPVLLRFSALWMATFPETTSHLRKVSVAFLCRGQL